MGKAFSTEFRNMIAELHIAHGKTIKSLAAEYGVSASTISRWVIYYRNKGLIDEQKLSKGVPFDSFFTLSEYHENPMFSTRMASGNPFNGYIKQLFF